MTAKNFELLTENLQKKGYQVSVFDNKESASEYLNAQIDGQTVGLGGSVTLRQMDLFNSLSMHNTVFWHEEKPEDMTGKSLIVK